jgi:DNA-binding MarR family transcriptional regulator
MKLFAGLMKIREYQRGQLPFLRSLAEWDIVIEIGYAEERGAPITLKQLLLLNICSRNTMRRKLAQLIEQQIVLSQKNSHDRRANMLVIAPETLRLLTRYGQTLKAIAGAHFKRGTPLAGR